ncbi:MAG: hypothetical protein BM564_06335 [Bacteroidetes bacterium MedPE-SWsnd-G2]|nr:MAG: hypothetical protein BM564_06335 [Bacteroidetes bacterium MedPE-SWsnd-G2]
MKKLLLILSLLFAVQSYAQKDQLALSYYKKGQFEKALLAYQKLFEKNPGSYKYVVQLVKINQQLGDFDEAEKLLLKRMTLSKSPVLFVELGYNYQLKENLDKAKANYQLAIDKIDERPNFTYSIGKAFEDHSLLPEAIQAYNKGMSLNAELNYHIQLARIYGEQGNISALYNSYLNYLSTKPEYLNNVKRIFSGFVSEDATNENNVLLKKTLLKKIQTTPDLQWNELLSWLYVQEEDYKKSFTQEKAIYKRNPESLDRIFELGLTASDKKQYDIAISIFEYIIENSLNIDSILAANEYILDIKVAQAEPSDYESIHKNYKNLIKTYGITPSTLLIQVAKSNFVAFYLNKPEDAIKELKNCLKLNLNKFQESRVKLKLGDVLVYQEKFNEALIYYSQIQMNLKNSTISQEARFKVAKTSYYKGDFDWAESQLKILKSSTSQLIANDALDLKLLISDNKYEDSLQTSLKLYSKADLLAFQNNSSEAIKLLDIIRTEHKGESIEDQALFKQAQLFEAQGDFDSAIENYNYIIANYREDILADDAYFALANLYAKVFNMAEKAKPLYEAILFEHQDSIYFIEARKQFRKLRGDAIN